MTAQNFPDKHQANSLPVRLGGKEGAEEFSFGLFTYPRTIVNDFDRSGGSGPYYYLTLEEVRKTRKKIQKRIGTEGRK